MTRARAWLSMGLWFALHPSAPAAFERTETREPCAASEPLRRPFFGDLHVHTARSFDAYVLGGVNDPRAAYAFAQGATVGLPPVDAQGIPLRSITLRRPLDFAAVTDHSELLGELDACTDPGDPAYGAYACRQLRSSPGGSFALWGARLASTDPQRFPFCGPTGAACLDNTAAVWAEHRAAAEEHYDRSAACRFTTLIGYEWTGSPGGDTLHRNVLFRNAEVPPVPISYIEAPTPEARAQVVAERADHRVIERIPQNAHQHGDRGQAWVEADDIRQEDGVEDLTERIEGGHAPIA